MADGGEDSREDTGAIRRVRVDMHTHSEASSDSEMSIAELAHAVRAAKLDVVCVTDHNTIDGALRLHAIADGFRVIVGEEVSSRDGEIIGLFLTRAVPAGLSAEETIALIREQHGVVIVPHPFSATRPDRLRRDALERLWPQIDALEILNGRDVSASDNRRAAAYARERRIPGTAGSDAHRASQIGRAFSELPDFATAEELLVALRANAVRHRMRSLATRLISRVRDVVER